MLTYSPPPIDVDDRDTVYDEAVKLVSELGVASASLFQRHLKLGYARAARLLDQLEAMGIIGPGQGAKPREILIQHKNREGQLITPIPKPKLIPEFEPLVQWHKTKYTGDKPNNFEVALGVDENRQPVSLNLNRYGNLVIIGSQYTGTVDLLNNILVNLAAKYPPEELRLIVADGVPGDLVIPRQSPHLLCPLILDPIKVISALRWTVEEISRRMKLENQDGCYKVLILINSFNQTLFFSPAETEELIYRVITQGRKYGIFVILSTDYPSPRSYKEILANNPAKLVFKPTDKKIARDTGIPESINLVSPNEAILETMFEGKKKLTINKVSPKQIYEEIFE